MKSMSKKLALIMSGLFIVSSFTGFTFKAAKAGKTSLTVEVFDRSNAPAGGGTCDNNGLTQQIQKQFGDKNNIAIKWVPVPRSQEKTKLNILMASGTAPDIVFTYDQTMFQNYASQGGLTDLTDLYYKSPNLKKFEGTNIENGIVDGRIYAIPAKRSIISKHCAFIRQDLLEKAGLKMPTTAAEFEAVLKAFKKLQPDIYPYELINTATNSYDLEFGADLIIKSFLKTNISDLDYQTKAPYLLPGYKDGIAFLNKLFNEGLVDPEFALDTGDTKFTQNLTNGKVGFYIYDTETMYGGNETSKEALLEKNVKGAKMVPMLGLKNSAGKYMHPVYAENGYYIMVPKTSKKDSAAAAVKYLDWMTTAAGGKLVNWGVEGVHYKLDKNGIADPTKGDQDLRAKQLWNQFDIANMYNGVFAPSKAAMLKIIANDTANYGANAGLYLQSWKYAMTDTYRNYYYIPAFDKPIDDVLKYQGNLDTFAGTSLVKCIMAKPGEFNKTWSDFVTQFLKDGGQKVQDAKVAAYKVMHKK